MWLRIDANISADPRILSGGFWCCVAFETALKACKLADGRGILSKDRATPGYLAWMCHAPSESLNDFTTGLESCYRFGLLVREQDGSTSIPGWKKFQIDPGAAERQRRHRQNDVTVVTVTKQGPEMAPNSTNGKNVTAENHSCHSDNECHGDIHIKEREEGDSLQSPPSSSPSSSSSAKTRKRPRPESPQEAVAEKLRVEAIFNYWQDRMGKKGSALSPKRRDRIRWAYAAYGDDLCRKAIDGCKADQWHMDNHHNDLTLIFRNAEKTERFIEMAPRNGNGHTHPKPDPVFDAIVARVKAGNAARTAEFAAKRAAGLA